MEIAIKLLIVLLGAPFWYKQIKLILLEISRVAQLPEGGATPERIIGNRNVAADKAWNRDDGRITNARWSTGRRAARSASEPTGGRGFPTRRKRTGFNANQTRFGSGGWQGGFGRR